MFKYIDVVNVNSDHLRESLCSLSEFLEALPSEYSHKVEEEMIKQIGIFNEGHFTRESAYYVIHKMKHTYLQKPMEEILSEKGVTVENARNYIQEAYEKARETASQHGFSAPRISDNYSDYDYLVSLAMCIADFWLSCEDDISKYSLLAYQWMSDVDSNCTKVWDYFFH